MGGPGSSAGINAAARSIRVSHVPSGPHRMRFPSLAMPELAMRSRIVLLLLAFGLAPAILLGAAFLSERGELRRAAMDRLADAAASLGDTIDRNLFERY